MDADEAASRHVVVVCPICRARLNPRIEWVGRKIRCPDCHSAVEVKLPPPAVSAKPARYAGEYKLGGNAPPADAPAADAPRYFPIACPTCWARLHPRIDQVGRRMRCPDCDTKFVIPPPQLEIAPRPLPAPGEYGVGKQPERQPVSLDYLAARRRTELTPDPIPPPPTLWYASGVFSFPWSLDALARWLTLSMIALAASLLVLLGVLFTHVFTVVSLVVWVFVLRYVAVCFLGIVQDTADGHDEVSRWPDGDWGESLPVLGYVILVTLISFGIAAAITLPCALLLGGSGTVWAGLASLGIGSLLFPFVLLSALHAQNPFFPFSPVMLASLVKVWWAWLMVYAELFCLVSVPAAIAAVGLVRSPFLTVLIVVPVLSAVMFIGARLIGRLAWRIGVEMGPEPGRKRKARPVKPS